MHLIKLSQLMMVFTLQKENYVLKKNDFYKTPESANPSEAKNQLQSTQRADSNIGIAPTLNTLSRKVICVDPSFIYSVHNKKTISRGLR